MVALVAAIGLGVVILSGPPPAPTPAPAPTQSSAPPELRLLKLEPALLFEGSFKRWPAESRARIKLSVAGHPERSLSARTRTLKFKDPLPLEQGAYRAQIVTPDGPVVAGLELRQGEEALELKVWPMQPIADPAWVYLDRRGQPDVATLWIGALEVSLTAVEGERFQIPAPRTPEAGRVRLGAEDLGTLPKACSHYLIDLAGGHSYSARTITYSVEGKADLFDTARVLSGGRAYPLPSLHFGETVHFLEPAPQSFEVMTYGQLGTLQTRLEVLSLD